MLHSVKLKEKYVFKMLVIIAEQCVILELLKCVYTGKVKLMACSLVAFDIGFKTN